MLILLLVVKVHGWSGVVWLRCTCTGLTRRGIVVELIIRTKF
jgi:hypothetical protein